MSTNASSWSLRYQTGHTPWDLGNAHPDLVARLAADPTLGMPAVGTVAVPGCGSGFDATAFADAGWDVTALDFAKGAQALVEQKLDGRGRFVLADMFTYEPDESFDLVFDHTCFCAIDPELRSAFGEAMDRWLEPHGRFISMVFPIGKPIEHGGPPHAMSVEDLITHLPESFSMVSRAGADCAGRRWDTEWAVFDRT